MGTPTELLWELWWLKISLIKIMGNPTEIQINLFVRVQTTWL
jgi:hypothetical protein